MPNTGKKSYVGARLDHDEYAQVCAVADMEADSMSGVLKKAIRRLASKHAKTCPRDGFVFLPKGVPHPRGKTNAKQVKSKGVN